MLVSFDLEIMHSWEILSKQMPPKEAQGISQPQDLGIWESEKRGHRTDEVCSRTTDFKEF